MTTVITAAATNAGNDAILALVNASGNGLLEIWTTAFGTKIVTLTMAATAFGASAAGVATAGTITSGVAVAAGTAAVYKVTTGAGTEIFRGSVGSAATDIVFSSGVVFTLGQTIGISSMTVTLPTT